MISFAKGSIRWLNKTVKNSDQSITNQNKVSSIYLAGEIQNNNMKSTDINVLLNRIELNKKNESRKKIYFSAIASTGLFLFGILIF